MKDAIPRELAIRYAQIMDDRAFDHLEEIMADDVLITGPSFEARGLAAFREQVKILNNFSRTMHLIANQIGQWQGDSYQGETWCIASHIYEKDGIGRKLEMGIRYQETIALRSGSYRYTHRHLDVQWESDTPLKA